MRSARVGKSDCAVAKPEAKARTRTSSERMALLSNPGGLGVDFNA
jgi:hypothetical protein